MTHYRAEHRREADLPWNPLSTWSTEADARQAIDTEIMLARRIGIGRWDIMPYHGNLRIVERDDSGETRVYETF